MRGEADPFKHHVPGSEAKGCQSPLSFRTVAPTCLASQGLLRLLRTVGRCFFVKSIHTVSFF